MRRLVSAAVAVLAIFAACSSTQLLYSVYDHPFDVPAFRHIALNDVTSAIFKAGHFHGWAMKEIRPGHIVATLEYKKLMAQVDIRYTTEKFSITRRDSANFHFNPENKTIHKRFNRWIQILEKEIVRFL